MGSIVPSGHEAARVQIPRNAHRPRPFEDEDDDENVDEAPLIPILFNRHSFADLPPPGEIPRIGKAGALIGFHRIDSAVSTFEKDTGSIRVLLQSQTVPLRPQTSETLDKFVFRTLQKAGDA
jgi:hypothetical protein